ncbi:hypothetical protein QEZ40_005890 [Streptomyces katrae]|uniref:Secreted protein n=1 Tax=Streptomyces katrae TaxID=68223 RepID=A0ABT7H2X4_9ACTN|nr:hypothetical protein [Streptomyces katrae]MDK9500260.1 hypothetical protein [Streptomyces katrae]
MKLRHVRAVAVFGIAVVALTGARGSHGASCGGGHSTSSSHSGSSSTSGGTSTTGGGSDSSTTTGSTSTGTSSGTNSSTTTGSVTGGSRDKAERDIRIDGCKLDSSGKNLVAKLTVTNSSSLDYTYNITMKFRGDATSTAVPATAMVSSLKVKAGASQPAEATTPYFGKTNGTEYKECVVVSASKSSF